MHVVRVTEDNLSEIAELGAKILSIGGVVLYPTDTLYGLGVNALNEDALLKLRRVKAREQKKPISVVVKNHEEADKHVELSDEARALMEKHLPGALTLVVPAKAHIPLSVQLNGALGVRIPDDVVALALAEAFGGPITATSANISGYRTAHSVEDILQDLGRNADAIDLVIDAGERNSAHPSTVVTLINGVPHILREGRITREEL